MMPPDTLGETKRSYAGAPPTIPHRVEGHQTDLNANRCLRCHRRAGEAGKGVPSISVTHFYSRRGEATASLADGRYFCLQCHVPRHRSELPIGNNFRGTDNWWLAINYAGQSANIGTCCVAPVGTSALAC